LDKVSELAESRWPWRAMTNEMDRWRGDRVGSLGALSLAMCDLQSIEATGSRFMRAVYEEDEKQRRSGHGYGRGENEMSLSTMVAGTPTLPCSFPFLFLLLLPGLCLARRREPATGDGSRVPFV